MNKMKKAIVMIATVGLMLPVCMFPAYSQTDKTLLAELIEKDREAVDALVMYPAETRLAILEVAMHPEILMRMKAIQTSSQSAFMKIVSPFSQEEQEQFYQLTRYPQLTGRLLSGGKKSNSEIKALAADFPEEIQETAAALGRKRYDELAAIQQLSATAEEAVGKVLANYPAEIQESARQLLGLPEVVEILTDNMQLTVLTGDIYRQDPEWVLHKADSLHLELARTQAEELAEWKKSLENDPEALNEMKASAEEYAAEKGSDPAVYRSPRERDPVRVYVRYSPFSYWFGYPYWYGYAYWYPYPVWWDWGFYYGPGHRVIVFGLPSYHFVHWHFYRYPHHYRYAHLSHVYFRHYERHRGSTTSIAVVTRSWEQENRNAIGKDWLANDGGRVDRFREFGRMEEAYQNQQRISPGKVQNREEFLKQNRSSYPALDRAPNLREADRQRETPIPQMRGEDETARPPIRKEQPQVRPPEQRERPPVYTRPKAQPQARPQPTPERQPDRAAEYHKERWEQQRPPATVPPRSPQPPVVQPQKRQPATTQPRQTPPSSRENPVQVKPQKRN